MLVVKFVVDRHSVLGHDTFHTSQTMVNGKNYSYFVHKSAAALPEFESIQAQRRQPTDSLSGRFELAGGLSSYTSTCMLF